MYVGGGGERQYSGLADSLPYKQHIKNKGTEIQYIIYLPTDIPKASAFYNA